MIISLRGFANALKHPTLTQWIQPHQHQTRRHFSLSFQPVVNQAYSYSFKTFKPKFSFMTLKIIFVYKIPLLSEHFKTNTKMSCHQENPLKAYI